jgi:hypothetical protein
MFLSKKKVSINKNNAPKVIDTSAKLNIGKLQR